MNESRSLLRPLSLAIAATVLVMCWLRFSLNFNTPYLDECDYIFVGRVLLSGIEWKTHTYIFSSDLPLYVMGLADTLGSYVMSNPSQHYLAARVIAMLLGLWSLVWFYRAVKVLFDNITTAGLATVILAVQAPHIFISKFATYDIVCLAFFAPALWAWATAMCAEKQSGEKQSGEEPSVVRYALLAAVLLVGAVLSKYIALAYAPLLVLTLWLRSRVASLVACAIGLAVLGVYVFANRDDLLLLYHRQILGDHKANSTYAQILLIIVQYVGALALMLPAAWLIVRSKVTFVNARLYAALAVLALPLLLYHLYTRDLLSLNKHTVYATIFLSVILADVLRLGLESPLGRRIVVESVAAAMLVGLTALAWYNVRDMERAFPNTSRVVEFVHKEASPRTSIMSEDPYLFRYHFYPMLPLGQLQELLWFDNNMDGKFEQQDVIDALWEGKFEFVYLNEQNSPYEFRQKLIDGVLPHSYEKVYEEPYSISQVMNRHNQGTMTLYRRRH